MNKNKRKGRAAEKEFEIQMALRGKEVIPTGRGHDYKVRTRDPLTGRVKKTKYYEIKSSKNAPVSKLQKKIKKKKKGNYQVRRIDPFFY